MQTSKPLVVIIGVGPGLGLSVAKKFANENFNVALISRGEEQLQALAIEIQKSTGKEVAIFPTDVSNPDEIISVFKQIHSQLGDTQVLIYNAAAKFELKGICDIDTDTFVNNWKVSCLGGLVAVQQVLPNMIQQKRGTIIFTGATAATRGSAKTAAFAVGKFSQRALAQSMAREFAPQGIHVAHVIIDGQIVTPQVLKYFPDRPLNSFLNPDAIAETYWQLYKQDQTVWSHEIDLRPFCEKF